MGKVVKHRIGLLREVVESPSLAWMWHSLLWVGIGHRLDSMFLELFPSLNGSGILSSSPPFSQTVLFIFQPQEQVENMINA